MVESDPISEKAAQGGEAISDTSISETVVSLGFLFLGLYLVITGRNLGFWRFGQPGPGFFPVLLGVSVSVMALPIVVQTVGAFVRNKVWLASRPRLLDRVWAKPLAGFILVCAYVFLIPRTGFLASTVLFSTASLFLMSWRGWRVVVGAVALGVIATVLFSVVFGVRLP